ncbi:MAG TPA: DUF2141 domain-containing protein [Steroidobacteraceae bacterium]|nr:DUF2141 domain-containing protein [Steroidobacteraceae bacterium]
MKTLLTLPSIAAMWVLAAVANAGELTVTITDIREARGFLMVALVNSDAAWNDQDKPVAAQKVPAAKGEVKLQFKDLMPGAYAVQVMHDENENNQLDTNFLGIPTEGYGFSNNPNVMRKAHYDEARFDVGVEAANITIRLR